jgi:hypothetical protein
VIEREEVDGSISPFCWPESKAGIDVKCIWWNHYVPRKEEPLSLLLGSG